MSTYTNPNATSFTGSNDLNSFSNYMAPNQGDAWAYLSSILNYYGLSSLNSNAQDWVKQGLSNTEVVQAIRQTPTYKQVFAPLIQRQQAGLPAISEGDVINLRQQYSKIDQSMGAPEGFNGQHDYDQFIVNDMDPTEYQDRWMKGYQAAQNSDPATRAALQDYYGVTDGHMAAYYLDPTKTLNTLQNQLTSAQIGGAANASGYGGINASQADYLRSIGVDQQHAEQGFGDLAYKQQLFNNLPGQDGNAANQQQGFAAEFANNTAAQEQIKQVGLQRAAATQGGGAYQQDKSGFGGVGQNF